MYSSSVVPDDDFVRPALDGFDDFSFDLPWDDDLINTDDFSATFKSEQDLSSIHKKYASNCVKKRKKQLSVSLPQSPEPEKFEIDFPSSLCFEDLKGDVDFDEFVDGDINISPEKAFNRSFNISDALDCDSEVKYLVESDLLANIDIDPSKFANDDDANSNFLLDYFETGPDAPRCNDSTDKPAPRLDSDKNLEKINIERVRRDAVVIEKSEDTEDFVDVESLSDCETSIDQKHRSVVDRTTGKKTSNDRKNSLLKAHRERAHLDHNYCLTRALKETKTKNVNKVTNDRGKNASLLKKSDENSLKVKNVIIVENGKETTIDINKDCSKLKFVDRKTVYDEYVKKKSLEKQKNKIKQQNLSKSTKKENVRMVSLLKCNYENNRTSNVVDVKNNKPQNGEIVTAKKVFDPISEATKKVLMLKQQRLKAQQRPEDKIVMSKIPKVNNLVILPMEITENGKLLPMIKKLDDKVEEEPREIEELPSMPRILNAFRELIVVSVGTNTDATDDDRSPSPVEHGEDKTIMHLDPDLIKPTMATVAVQTDNSNEDNLTSDHIRLINRWKPNAASKCDSEKSFKSDYSSLSSISDKRTRYNGRNSKHKHRRRSSDGRENQSDKTYKRKRISSSDLDNKSSKIGESKRHIKERSSSVSSTSSLGSISSSTSSYSSYSSRSTRSSQNEYSSRRKGSEKRNSCENGDFRKSKVDNCVQRKVVYVGMLERDMTVPMLRAKFTKYGRILATTIHNKKNGLRFGFVTFSEAEHTYKVLENAATDPDISHYDVYFGGRRQFCQQSYEDLDDLVSMQEELEPYPCSTVVEASHSSRDSFDDLLRKTQAALQKRKTK